MIDLSKSIRPNEIEAIFNKFSNYFTLIKKKECWKLQIKRGFPPVLNFDNVVLTYWKGQREVDIYTEFDLILTSKNVFGYQFYSNLETKNIKLVEEHLTRMAAFLLSTQHLEGTYSAEFKKEQSRIKVAEVEKDFK